MRKKFLSIGCMLAGSIMSWAQSQRPNVVVILADDLGFGDVSAYGSTTIHTPNIDSIANSGVRFNNGYACSATSTPSRYGLFTGMYPWKNQDAKILDGDAPLIINHNGYTLPKMMKQEGYATAAIGKWHLGMGDGYVDWNETIAPGPKEVGFDFSCVAAATNDRVPTVYVQNGRVLNLDPDDPIYIDYKNNFEGEPSATDNPELMVMKYSHGHNQAVINGIPRIGYMKGGEKARWDDYGLADFYVGKVKEFLTQNADTTFSLYYGLHQPHVPRTPNQRFAGISGMGPRGDAIIEADWCVGEVMATLDSLNLLDNTIVIFSSDNGPVLDDGYVDQAVELLGDHKPTGGLRGGKYSLFDGGMHVPLFVSWRGHIEPMQSDALVCLIDLPASLGRLIGAAVPDGLDSQEMLGAFMGKDKQGRENLVIEAEQRLGLRTPQWILIPPYDGKERNITGNELGNMREYGLFDVANDPFQTKNVASEHPDVLQRLKQEFSELTKIQNNIIIP